MADETTVHEAHGTETVHRHEPPKSFIRKYVFSLDHKVIGVQYLTLALVAVFIGMTLSVLMRFSLTWPDMNWPIIGSIKPDQYLALLTIHGTMMVFFVLTTAPQGG
ncbi:MAG TPA: cbb3-type cytochrome c oxidase subunit I, partial [Pyrinomonadaceae bacterium]|nr:cbb3-type cytochrome c oxidase subunit I [Pyrinomonadaceae bacterium]